MGIKYMIESNEKSSHKTKFKPFSLCIFENLSYLIIPYIFIHSFALEASIYLISYESCTRLGLYNSKGNRQNNCLYGVYWCMSV